MAKTRSVTHLRGKWHHHGCTTCLATYVCACQTPEVAAVCISCKSGRRAIWDVARLPRQCCLDAQPIQKMPAYELKTYKCAGTHDWFRCRTCALIFAQQPGLIKPKREDFP